MSPALQRQALQRAKTSRLGPNLLGLVCALGTACVDDPPAMGDCGGAPCRVPTDKDRLLSELDGFEDPVAAFLRATADEQAVVSDDFETVVEGIHGSLPCADPQRSTFVVLSNRELAPKTVMAGCASEPTVASTALAILEPNETLDDVAADLLRFVGWDEAAGQYRRYQFAPHPQGGLGVVVEPAFCAGCHAAVPGDERWAPIMNEMTNPWAQWNATPGFASFEFDEALPEQAPGGTFERLSDEAYLDSASNLEPIIRAAIDRVAASAVAEREQAANVGIAESLLRPVFCDDTVNFVSEVHDSGELLTSAAIDPAIRRHIAALSVDWPWSWYADDSLRVEPPRAPEQPLALIAVRAQLSIEAEAALVSRAVLEPTEVLRVRALDWMHPVNSAFRCGLFEDGVRRFDPTAQAANTATLVQELYDEVMRLRIPGGGLQNLRPGGGNDVIAIADATDPQTAADIAAVELDEYAQTLQQWGDTLEAYVDELQEPAGRETLAALARTRACWARASFPTAPIIPGSDDCP